MSGIQTDTAPSGAVLFFLALLFWLVAAPQMPLEIRVLQLPQWVVDSIGSTTQSGHLNNIKPFVEIRVLTLIPNIVVPIETEPFHI